MSLNNIPYYVMSYSSDGDGCPESLVGFFNYEEFEWEPFERNPLSVDVRNNYILKLSGLSMDINDLDFDFYQNGSTYVSGKFLKVCDEVGAIYRAVPLTIKLREKSREGGFFIFLPGEHLPALDKTLSKYQFSKNAETGCYIESPLYSGEFSIDSIDSFVLSGNVESNIFRCQETLEIFCSEGFKLAASNLKGILFSAVDDSYKYDPWAEFDSI
jgi:hypothetical protein